MNLTRGINLKKIADQLHQASGAEIKAVCTGPSARLFALLLPRLTSGHP